MILLIGPFDVQLLETIGANEAFCVESLGISRIRRHRRDDPATDFFVASGANPTRRLIVTISRRRTEIRVPFFRFLRFACVAVGKVQYINKRPSPLLSYLCLSLKPGDRSGIRSPVE